MDQQQIDRLTTLGHAGRMALYRLLVRRYPDFVASGELADVLEVRPNTMSVYLGALSRAGLITQKRDGRSLLYRFDPDGADSLVSYLYDDCCRGRPAACATPRAFAEAHEKQKVLFLCTGNSARSIMAEVILRDLAGDQFEVFSAGTRPAVVLHPATLQLLEDKGHDVSGLQPKHMSDLEGEAFDFVFTVCDMAANEDCPVWPGQPVTAHWGVPDPAHATGSDAEKGLAFQTLYGEMHRRLTLFAALDTKLLDRFSLQNQIDEIPMTGEK
ncbi:helix-turn-helix domain-containing protein [Aliiroseovarius sp. KMU-50]|uniref:Helix-turn-helix domain-containing protein n=1 Tax=Aliiroseovarius salicola TaxID=3009082 RepID=A0ABT4W4D9_9RHOB|nr:helix-turn-helix domain-containing protein [Aliiroseovarius sp. KMU-50]MDA5095284.1 helix-turn-helix domain-containing protein [Aliiroseovarius sp. KMU-50]